MKKLFKNSFFSFFKNKLAISLLMIIVFLTTATFTMFNSATHAFKKSYDQVMTEGNRHDYTIKEMYAAPGDVTFTKPQAVVGETVEKSMPSKYKISVGGKDYVVFEAMSGNGPVFFAIDYNTAISNKNSNVNKMQAKVIVGVMTSAGYPQPPASIDDLTTGELFFAPTLCSIDLTAAGLGAGDIARDDFGFDTFKVSGPATGDANFMATFTKAVNSASNPAKDVYQVYSFTLDRNIAAFSDVNKDIFFNIGQKDSNKFTFKFTLPTSFNPATDDFMNSSNKFTIVRGSENGTLADSFKTLKEWQDAIRDRMVLKYKEYMHENVIKSINSHPELVYKDVKSFKVTDQNTTFKFVKEDSSSEVDKLKIYQGDSIPNSSTKDEMFTKWQKDIPLLMQTKMDELQKIIDPLVEQKEALRLKIENSNEYKDFVKNSSAASSTTQRDTIRRDFYAIPWVAETDKNRNDLLNKINELQRIHDDKEAVLKQLQDLSKVNDATTFYTGWSTFYTDAYSTFRVIDPSAYAAIVSPTYASNHSIKPISKSVFEKITNSTDFRVLSSDADLSFIQVKEKLEKIAKDNGASNSIIWSGKTPYFAVGIGVTPDFAFPIISSDQPIPDTQSQAIIYTNNAGFLRNKDANPGALTEDYIALAFKNGVSDSQKDAVIKSLKSEIEKFISWPSGINALEKYDSSSESVLLTPSRITFLEKLNHTISSVSWIVTSLLVLFTAFIVSLVIKKQIDGRKKQLGILLANGYSKLEIASSMMVIGLIVAVIPSFAGYLTGHFMQFGLMSIFSNYWTLPIWHTQFSWITLLVTVIAPLTGMGALAFLISMWALRGRIPEILAGDTAKTGFITRNAMRPMKYFGIKTKMGMSLVFSNVGKLSIAFIAFAASIIAMSVSMNSVGKFDYARDQSVNATDYEYQVDLMTPTQEGGLYSAQTLDNIYYQVKTGTNLGNRQTISNGWQAVREALDPLKQGDKDHREDGIYIHVASMADAEFAAPSVTHTTNRYPDYLKNRIQTKTLLNFDIQTNTNPWKIASQMMPENQKNTADLKEDKFIDFAVKSWKDSDSHHSVPSYIVDNKVDDDNGIRFRLPENTTLYKSSQSSSIDPDLLDIYAYGLYAATLDRVKNVNSDAPLPYMMSYNNVIVDKNDEAYTHIDIKFAHENMNGATKSQDLKIRGIDENKLLNHQSKISLSDLSVKSLIDFKPQNHNNIIPIVVNKYFSEYYKLKNGDKFTNKIENTTDRYLRSSTNKEQPEQEFQIVGVENTFNEGKVYTLQSYANKVIGLTDLYTNSPATSLVRQSSYGAFNGIMTAKDNTYPMIFDSLPLYSPSGIYPGKNSISLANKNEDGYVEVADSYFTAGKTFTANPAIKNMDSLIQVYGNGELMSPMQSLYSTVDWTQVSDYQFNSIMHLSSTLMNTVQAIVMFIALAFVLLISTMVIADNKRFIATLKVMGYRTKEISKIFLATFIPSLVLALMVAIPLSFGILEAVRVGIMGFGHVLIPLYLVGWEIVAAFAVLVIGFLAMYFLSLRGMKNTSLLQAFQE